MHSDEAEGPGPKAARISPGLISAAALLLDSASLARPKST